MQFAFIIFLISGFALLIRKLIRFKCYWERLTYGPVRPMNQRHLYDQQYLYLCRKFTFRGEPDEPVNGFYDPVAEFQMQNLDVHVRFASLINQQVLNTEEQADLHAAYIRWQVEMALEQKQLEEKLRADQELTRRQQLQEWEAMKQLAATKSLLWQFWNCS